MSVEQELEVYMGWKKVKEPGIQCWVKSNGEKTYSVVVYRNGKREYIKAGNTLDMARQIKSQLCIQKFDAQYFPERQKKIERIRLSELLPLYVEHHLKTKAPKAWPKILNRLENIQKLLGDPYLDEISTFDVQQMLSKLRRKGDQPSTLDRYQSRLNNVLKTAVQWKFLIDNPVEGLSRDKEKDMGDRYLTSQEYQRLMNTLPDGLCFFTEVAAHSGMRQGELLALRWADVDLESEFIVVRSDVSKTGKYRRLPIHPRIKKLLEVRPRESEWVFPFRTFPSKQWAKAIRQLKWDQTEVARLRKWRFHDLRHHFASQLVMKNVPLSKVGKLLGHKAPQSTMRYAHLSDSSLVDAIDVLDFATTDASDPVLDSSGVEQS